MPYTISNFSKLRTYLEQEDAKQKQQQQHPTQNRKVAVPRMKDRAAWHVFCLGKEEAYGNAGGYYEDSGEEEQSENTAQVLSKSTSEGVDGAATKEATAQEQPQNTADGNAASTAQSTSPDQLAKLVYNSDNIPANGYSPTTSLLLQFDQVLTRTVFHHHVHFLCEWRFSLTHSRAMWMYALLARMEKPWHREECSAVRRVLRECCARRWELVLPPESVPSTSDDKDEKLAAVTKPSVSSNNTQSTSSKGEEDTCGAWKQLALLNTLIAITGVYYEQGAAVAGDGMDSLFKVACER